MWAKPVVSPTITRMPAPRSRPDVRFSTFPSSNTAFDEDLSSTNSSASSPPVRSAVSSVRWISAVVEQGGLLRADGGGARGSPCPGGQGAAYRTQVPLGPGLHGSAKLIVGDADTAVAMRSGEVPVLATPRRDRPVRGGRHRRRRRRGPDGPHHGRHAGPGRPPRARPRSARRSPPRPPSRRSRAAASPSPSRSTTPAASSPPARSPGSSSRPSASSTRRGSGRPLQAGEEAATGPPTRRRGPRTGGCARHRGAPPARPRRWPRPSAATGSRNGPSSSPTSTSVGTATARRSSRRSIAAPSRQ